MTGFSLDNGEFAACVYKGLIDDFAAQAVDAIARKVLKSGRKKFSALILKANDREISAWDYYCYGLAKGNPAFADKFVSDFLRLSLVRRIEKLPEEERRLLAIAALPLGSIREDVLLDVASIIDRIDIHVRRLAASHGATLVVQAEAVSSRPRSLAPRLTVHHSSTNGASP